MKQGQGAFEYILVVGIALFLVVPGALLFYNYSLKTGDELTRSKIDMIGKEIIDSAEKVYYIGENSWQTIKLAVPENVNWIYILNDNELVIEYESHVGVSQAVFFSDINITTPYTMEGKAYISDPTDVHPGLNIIKITSMGSYVVINETG